jgi:hypothetical protein
MLNEHIMNRLNKEPRSKTFSALVEGNSLRATARMCDVSFNTIFKLVPEIGRACMKYQDSTPRNLTCRRIECDEIWSFCYAKDKNVPEDKKGTFGFGDVRTWVAIDPDIAPAMEARISDRVSSVEDIAGLLESKCVTTCFCPCHAMNREVPYLWFSAESSSASPQNRHRKYRTHEAPYQQECAT